MRLGFDAYPLAVSMGGVRRYARELLRALVALDEPQEILLYRGPREGGLATTEPSARPRAVSARLPLSSLIDHLWVPGIAGRVDLYHATNYFRPLFCPVPQVITIHDLTVQRLPRFHPLKRRVQHKSLPWMARRARRIIALSRQTRDDAVEHLGVSESKIDVIPLALSPHLRGDAGADEAQLKRLRDSVALPSRYLLYVGALEPRKSLEELVGAHGLLRAGGEVPPLVLAGSGQRSYVDRLFRAVGRAGLELGRDVILAGSVPDEVLPALYAHAELFIYPSVYEGFGLPPLEAMSQGTPVVLPQHSSLQEFFSDCCEPVAEVSAEALAEAVRTLLADEERRRELAARGRERARRRDWGDVARETLATYRRALG